MSKVNNPLVLKLSKRWLCGPIEIEEYDMETKKGMHKYRAGWTGEYRVCLPEERQQLRNRSCAFGEVFHPSLNEIYY